MGTKTYLTIDQVRQRLMRYCDKAERCQQDVLQQGMKWGLTFVESREMLSVLITNGFVSEQRYASAFVHDKFTFNSWGARKIELALRQKGVSEPNIRAALMQIPQEDEHAAIVGLIKKKEPQLRGLQLYQKKSKLYRYLMSKGFVASSIERALAEYFIG